MKEVLTGSCKPADKMAAMVDADYASCPTTRRSTSGWLVFLAGAPIAWGSKKQSITATSSAEAEYVALATCAKDVMALRHLISQLPVPKINGPTIIYEDNSACIKMVKNPRGWKHTKHIDVRLHFVRDLNEANELEIEHCAGDMQIADALTKPLDPKKYLKFRNAMLGLPPDEDF